MALTEIWYLALLRVVFQNIVFDSSNLAFAQTRNNYLKDPRIYYSTVGLGDDFGILRESPEELKTVVFQMELICADGYPAQEHKVVTDDGYVLTVHRIPNGRRRPKVRRSKKHYLKIHRDYHPDFEDCVRESLNETSSGVAVVMAHGVLMASDGWLLQGPGFDLAYLLADAGYDVWMVNVRGNYYSRVHKTLSPSDPKFWDFSFHENAVSDLPATIDHILDTTKRKKVLYVGMSMGTTIFFTMASARPEYNDKILGFAGLAPVVFMKEQNMNTRRRMIFEFLRNLMRELKRRKVYEIFPKDATLLNFARVHCTKGSQLQDFCYDLVSILVGYHSKLILRSKLHLYLTHMPTGTSIKTFQHYFQNSRGNQFKYYNYGPEQNTRLYGASVPPDYPLWNVTSPVALYYTDGDIYYDLKDEESLLELLPNVIDVQVLHKFNHGDYIWSYNAKELVYSRVLSVFNTLRDEYYLGSRNEIRKEF